MKVETAIAIELGKTYVVEVPHNISMEQAMVIQKTFQDGTGAKAIVLTNGARIARERTEQEIREQIAKKIEAKINQDDHTYSEGNSALEYAAKIARGQK